MAHVYSLLRQTVPRRNPLRPIIMKLNQPISHPEEDLRGLHGDGTNTNYIRESENQKWTPIYPIIILHV